MIRRSPLCRTDTWLTDRNKTRFNRLADGFGSALGKHAEWRKPALSKMNSTASQPADLGTRESLLTPGQQRQRSQSSVSQLSTTSAASSSSRTPEAKSLAEVESRYREESQMVKAAQEAVMQRPNFAIDAIGDSDGEDDEDAGDDGVMDEVEAFLKAHGDDDEGLTGEQKKVAEGTSSFSITDCTYKCNFD
jgi:hypothetical protein